MTHDGMSGWQQAIEPAKTAFFLDVDGTLLGFKARPEDVVSDAALLDLLQGLQRASGGAVALVSGRMADDLDRIVAPLILPLGAVHGADLRFADGRRETLEGAALAEVRAEAERFVAAHPGLRLEDKGVTLAVHYRAEPSLAEAVAHFAGDAVADRELMVQHGKMVAEIKSSLCHKGRAIEILMQTVPFAGRAPLFIGDDLTDEHGFETVNALAGVSIRVGPANERTVAQHRLANIDEVRDLLAFICRSDERHH